MTLKSKILTTAVLLALAPFAVAQSTPPTTGTVPPPTTTTSVPANRIANLFSGFLGSRENSLAIVTALRNGTSVTLVTAPPCPDPCTKPPPGVETPIDVSTRPMGWGNVRHTLALAQHSLAQAGITNPTPEQLAAALNGGSVTNATGTTVELKGILTMRASGMGWGQIAHAEGTSMGKVNQSIKPFKGVTTATASTTASTRTAAAPAPATSPKHSGITTAAGTSSGVVTAAGGKGNAHSQAGRGIVTGNGGSAAVATTSRGNGSASGHSNGHGNGHGNGHAAGAGVTTATNASASTTIVTAQGGGNNSRGNGHGNGHGKGGGK